jgi:hypothetical protein
MSWHEHTRSSGVSKRNKYIESVLNPDLDEAVHGKLIKKIRRISTPPKNVRRPTCKGISHPFPIIVDTNVFGHVYDSGDKDCRKILAFAEAGVFRLCKTGPIEWEVNNILTRKPEVVSLFKDDQASLTWAIGVLSKATDVSHFHSGRQIYKSPDPDDDMYLRALDKTNVGSGGRGSLITLDTKDLICLRNIYPELKKRIFYPHEYLDQYKGL